MVRVRSYHRDDNDFFFSPLKAVNSGYFDSSYFPVISFLTVHFRAVTDGFLNQVNLCIIWSNYSYVRFLDSVLINKFF